ncbi:hypothetical protein LOTGIDRAFT_158275 [Lottia gigantea]|uniref:TIR domain-containing protein n=2 Tax=Lottia gigantea TaxID=225164 RepID=V4AS14_LOTGI|nr:hypothetical protein LOTGIDRAFT_158275 [Lottia gigantea]ESP00048.1 hypothetical protein LOTGIDRAFT_158275 [Lottia gigantea]
MMNSVRLLVLGLLFVFYSMCNCEKDACSLKLCKCVKSKVKCSNTNLTYIPVLPNGTIRLFFDGNYLPLINEHTFSNITHLRYLEEITFQNCQITHISTNTFKFLEHLNQLWFSYNPLTTDSLLNLFSDLKNSFYHILKLKQIGLSFIPEGLFKNNFTLSALDLSYNALKTLNFTEFNSLGLKGLKVENNLVETIIIDKMINLRELYLGSNNIKSLPNFCQDKSYFPSLVHLDIQVNSICEYLPQYMNCLKNLSKIYLNHNCISLIQSGSFQELSSLKQLSISIQKNSKSTLTLEKYSFNNSNLAKLRLANNDMKIKNINPLAFSGCHGVKYLSFSDNSLSDPGSSSCTHLDQALSKLTSLQYLDLSVTRINEVPKSIQNFTELVFLNLYENGISNWEDRFWDGNGMLSTLDLGKNSIKRVSKEMFPAKFRTQLRTLSLQYNPIECICDNVWLIEWINRDHTKFKKFPRKYACLNMTEQVCIQHSSAYTSITGVCCVIFLLFILVSIVYKYRWFIKYQIYIWQHQPKLLNDMAERQYLYDVFVSYSAADDWVLDDLVPHLERNVDMKLCIHERDFQAGRLIIDNIVESIENSRRVLIVLSNNFARSEWCQFEMTLAQKHVLNRAMEPLSVVLLEDIDSENMSNSLHALLKTTTYITWYNDIEYIHLFWDRLKNSLI